MSKWVLARLFLGMSGRAAWFVVLGLGVAIAAIVGASFLGSGHLPAPTPSPSIAVSSAPTVRTSTAGFIRPHPAPETPPSTPPPPPKSLPPPPPIDAESPLRGLKTRDLSAQDIQDLKLPEKLWGGVVLTEVDPTSPGAEAHLAANDVIVRAGGEKVTTLDDLRRLIGTNNFTKIKVYRRGSPFEVVIYKPYHPKEQ
ncbi:MAG: PDZ domain-containing protein [Myxococcota bacterium]